MSRSPSPLSATLRKLVRSFLDERRAENLSSSIVAGNALHLERFIAWLEEERPKSRSIAMLDRALLGDYAVSLSLYETEDGHRLRASTRHGALVSLKVFFRWLERSGRVLADPSRDLPLPKVPQQLPRGVLSTKELERVLAVPDLATATGLRARAILELLYSTGIRNTELRNLELHDLNFAEGLVTVREGKGKKDRVVPMGKTAEQFLQRYLDEVRPKVKRSPFEEHVFLSRFGRPFSKTQLVLLLEKVGRAAGLRKPVTCHGLRHTCATHMLRGGADIRHIQEMLGHRTLSSTQLYTHVAASDLKRVHDRCHPRERKP